MLKEFTGLSVEMVKEFDEVAFALPIREVSPVVKTFLGYHLILVTQKTPAKKANGGMWSTMFRVAVSLSGVATNTNESTEESVRASHILIKTWPLLNKKVVATKLFVKKTLMTADIGVSEEFKYLLPHD